MEMRVGRSVRGLGVHLALGVLLLGASLSCSDTTVTGVEVARVEVTPSELTLSPDQSREIAVEVLDAQGRVLPDRVVTWSTDDPQVATVSRGLVTAQSTGSTVVRATAEGAEGTVDVNVGVGPSMELDPDTVRVSATAGSPDPQLQSVTISNSGGGTLDEISTSISWGAEGSGWLDLSLSQTTAPATLRLSASAEDLVAGTYTADVVVSSPAGENTPRTVHVVFQVQEGPPTIRVSASQVDFAVTEGGTSPPPDTIDVTNQGGGELTGLAANVRHVAGPSGWLDARLDGTVAPTVLVLAVETAGLTDGVYEAEVDVTSPDAANSPVIVDVTLRVGDPPASIRLSEDSVKFVEFHAGNLPAPQEVIITNQGGFELEDIRVSGVTYGSPFSGWLTLSALEGRAPDSLTLQPNTTNQTPGTYVATVTIEATAENSPQTVEVAYEIKPLADLEIVKEGSPDPVEAGGRVTYTITVTNAGPSEATSVLVEETAPDVLSFVSDSPSGGSYDPSTGTWTVGSLVADESRTLTLEFDVDPGARAPFENSVTVSSSVDDPDPADDSDALTTTVAPPVAPSGLSASAISNSRIDLSWTDNSTNETGFEVQQSTDGGASWTAVVTVDADEVAATIQPLTDGTTHTYRVRAVNDFTQSDYSDTASATTALAAPSDLSASAVSSSEIALTWTDNSDAEDGYEVQRRNVSAGGSFSTITTAEENSTGYTDSGLDPVTEYEYRVRAQSSVAGTSDWSNVAGATTEDVPPAAPTNLDATAMSTSRIDLTWTDDADNETSYEVERRNVSAGTGFSNLTTLSAGATSYSDTGLQDGTSYEYRVRAVNAAGASSYSNTAGAITPLAAPTNLSATAVSSSEIDLTWTDNSDAEDGYEVQRRNVSAGGSFGTITTVGEDQASFTDSGLDPVTEYEYRVRARSSVAGTSAWSDVAGATTEDVPPAAPTNLNAAAMSTSRIDLTWTDNADNETSYEVERRNVSAGTGFSNLTTLSAGATSYSDTGVQDGTSYEYRVRAVNAAGESSYSNTAGATTPLTAPTGLSASAVSSSEIDLTWSDNTNNETGYEVQRRNVSAGTSFSTITTVGENQASYTDSGLDPVTEYEYRVRAVSSTEGPSASSDWSDVAGATTEDVPPAAPTNLSATAMSTSRIDLTWTNNADNETSYEVERRNVSAGTGFSNLTTLPAGASSYSDTGLQDGTSYEYRVRAVNAAGPSSYSNTAGATTPLAAPTNLSATAVSSSEIDLTWNDNTNNETGYEVQRRNVTAGESFATVTTVGASQTSYPDTGLDPGTTYEYRVRAVSSTEGPSASSDWSDVAGATTSEGAE